MKEREVNNEIKRSDKEKMIREKDENERKRVWSNDDNENTNAKKVITDKEESNVAADIDMDNENLSSCAWEYTFDKYHIIKYHVCIKFQNTSLYKKKMIKSS